ncbi:MAG: type II secretion system ATPase GspE [Candidatus Tectomicrobia bacterium]|uniref:protein-secreting ATPase n=1 Tax=Tectimicrobiota bacterium TaxID=2528274 RepID=A0A932HZY7_UNCTE|nr:type II secretion system ATPase GspE [Candidatus Tectomicrobia bacterium]
MNFAVQERKRLGEWLQETAGLDPARLDSALAEQRLSGGLLGEILVGKGLVTERALLEALGRQWNVPYLEELDLGGLDPSLLGRLPVPFLLRHKVVPARQENGGLLVATVNPLNMAPVDALGSALEMRTEIALAPERVILSAIHSLYEREEHSAGAMIEELDVGGSAIEAPEGTELGEELDLSHDAPVIKLVNRVIYQAARDRASDIHWEPFEREMRVRLRVDGVLHDVLRFDQRYQAPVTARLKIMAGMDIAERRLPQDGRIQRKVGSREIDMRVSSVPTIHGERLVLRLLDRSSMLHSLEDIGLSGGQFTAFEGLIRRAHGIILVTGPTGSGKTTTLYAAIQKLHQTHTNIMTIEDPVEYQLDGIAQMQVSTKTGFGFSEGLRSVLRQDPDIILVGEIRDRETAEVAIHASLTGHLVFSTLHTNNAVGAITRLVDMGIEPFLISSSVIAVLAQRLGRRVCPRCAEAAPAEAGALERMGIPAEEIPALSGRLRRGRGCPECYQTGYRGRTGIFELLTIDDDLRELIMARKDASTLNAAAVKKGMRTLLADGARKVAAGVTTPEEVLRIIQT